MSAPIVFAILLPVALYYVGESAWRLWRQRPTHYASVFVEASGPLLLVWVAMAVPHASSLDVALRIAVCAGYASAAMLRLVARSRFGPG